VATKRRQAKPLSAKTRATDERLRDTLRHADLKVFDKGLAKAIKSSVRC
jgi:hypothetical protein